MPLSNLILSERIAHPVPLASIADKSRGIDVEKRDLVVRLHDAGLKNREIVSRTGVSLGSVSNILRAAGRGAPNGQGDLMSEKGKEADKRAATKGKTAAKPKTTRARKAQPEETPHTIAKRYKLPSAIVEAIKVSAPLYGSQGRALQVATELLVRLSRPLKVEMPQGKGATVVGMTYKLTPRTAELIDNLVEQYGTRGAVLAACARILDTKMKLIVKAIEVLV